MRPLRRIRARRAERLRRAQAEGRACARCGKCWPGPRWPLPGGGRACDDCTPTNPPTEGGNR